MCLPKACWILLGVMQFAGVGRVETKGGTRFVVTHKMCGAQYNFGTYDTEEAAAVVSERCVARIAWPMIDGWEWSPFSCTALRSHSSMHSSINRPAGL